jgi:hypothetical protein
MPTREIGFQSHGSFLRALVLYRRESPCHISLNDRIGAISLAIFEVITAGNGAVYNSNS